MESLQHLLLPPGTGYGCVGLTGTATPGQELGGPSGNGIYPMTVYFTATVLVFSIPAPQASSYTGYQLHILPASGLNSLNAGIFQFPRACQIQLTNKLNLF